MTSTRLLLVALLVLPNVCAADPAPTTEPSDSEIGAALRAISAQSSETNVPRAVTATPVVTPAVSSATGTTPIATGETAPAIPSVTAEPTPAATSEHASTVAPFAISNTPIESPVTAEPAPAATEPVSVTTPAIAALPLTTPSTTPVFTLAPTPVPTRTPASNLATAPNSVEFPPVPAVSKVQPHAPESAPISAQIAEPAQVARTASIAPVEHVTEVATPSKFSPTATPPAHAEASGAAAITPTTTAAPETVSFPSLPVSHTSTDSASSEKQANIAAAAAAVPSSAKAGHVDNSTASAAEHAAAPADNSLKLTVSVPSESESDAEVPPLAPDADLASLLRIGDAKREQRDWASATLAYRQVLNATNRATVEQTQAALLGLARSHRGAGNLTKACAVYEMFAKNYPGDAQLPTIFLELGRCLRVLGAHRLAISRFYSVINSTLKVSKEGTDQYRQLTRTAQFEIAETYFQAGDYEQAHRFYSRLSLLDLAPADRARAAFKSAYALNLQGNYEKAVTDLRSCLALYPDGENAPEARYLLSLALRRLGRNQESLAAALALLKIEQSRTKADPKNWAHWQRKTGNQLANEFYEQGDASTALVIYQCLYDLGGPADWRIPALYQIGLCQERLRQTGLARKTYQSILDTLRAPSGDDGKTAGLADVASMAEWRLRHLDWLETTDKRLLVFVPPAKVEIPKPPASPVPAATP